MPTLRTTIRPAIRTTARLIPGSLGLAPAFNPSSLNPIQRFLDASPTYHGSTVASYPVFTPEESYTSIAQPRAGRCWLFDGMNDYAVAAGSAGMIAPNMTFGGWVKRENWSAAVNGGIVGKGTNSQYLLFFENATMNLRINSDFTVTFNTSGLTSGWHHVIATVNGTTGKIYIDGELVVTGPTRVMPAADASLVNIGRLDAGVYYFAGSLKDILIDDEAYTAAEVLSLYTTHTVPTGKTPLAFYRCEEESGTTGYNSLANSNHLTLTNITQSTFHAVDAGVRYSDANERGHTNGIRLTSSGGASTDISNTWLGNRISGDFAVTYLLPATPSAGGSHFGVMTETVATTTNNYTLLECGLNLYDGNVRVWKNNALTDIVATTAARDLFKLTRVGSTYTIYKNGVSIHSFTGATGDVTLISTLNASVTGDLILLDSNEGDTATVSRGSSLTITQLVIPRNESTPAQDAAGNALGVTGPLKHPATTEVRCVTGDRAVEVNLGSALIPATADFNTSLWYFQDANNGTPKVILGQRSASEAGLIGVYANATGGASGSSGTLGMRITTRMTDITITNALTANTWHFITIARASGTVTLTCQAVGGSFVTASSSIGSGAVSVSANTKLFTETLLTTSFGRISDLRITTGGATKTFPLQEGPGTSNTNRDVHWVASDGTGGVISNAIINGTVSNIWANYCPFARSHCVEYGGNVAANGAFVPGRIGSNLDAAGNVKLLLPGEPSQHDLIYPNRWGMPALVNVGITSSTAWSKTTTVQATSPADTKFRNTTKGTKNIVVREPLVDPAKTQLQDYVSA